MHKRKFSQKSGIPEHAQVYNNMHNNALSCTEDKFRKFMDF